MSIEARGLTKTYTTAHRTVHALREVDLTIPTGSITAVVGESGAGKTTFGRCANLVQRPDSGRLLIDGTDVWAVPARDRRATARTIGTIFQGSRLLRRRTAWENVAFPMELDGVTRHLRQARALELLDRVGLADERDAYPAQLSGGQAQRVGIARALALGPRILISDEATSGLDPGTTGSILRLIRQIHDDDGLTVLLITHEMDVVRAVADRAAVLSDGRLVEQGAVVDLLADQGSGLGRALLPLPDGPAPDAGRTQLVVTYRDGAVPRDWVVRASHAIGAPLELVTAAVEQRDGRTIGRVTVAVPTALADRLPAELARLGLDWTVADERASGGPHPPDDLSEHVTLQEAR